MSPPSLPRILICDTGTSALQPGPEAPDVLWAGLQQRIPDREYRPHCMTEWDLSPAELLALCEPWRCGNDRLELVRDLAIERIVTSDRETGDWLVTWRIPFRLPIEAAR